LGYWLELTVGSRLGRGGGDVLTFPGPHDASFLILLGEEDGVTIRGKHDISEDIVEIQRRRSSALVDSSLGFSREMRRSKKRRGYVLVGHCWVVLILYVL